MAGMGPAPKADGRRRRRNLAAVKTQLPAEGRAGDPPEWPLGSQSESEARVWAGLWATPQAVAWEQLGYLRVVARYCRALVRAEKAKAPIGLMGEVRQLEDRLGLTPMSMLRLQWEIAGDELEERREESHGNVRKRLRAVDE